MITEQQLEKNVRYLMYLNIKAGISPFLKTKYCYVMPSPGNYPFQWWWDTFFNIFILCSLNDKGDLELAKRNFETLFKMQRKDGFVGHMIFWENLFPKSLLNVFQGPPKIDQVRPHMSSLIQPPLAAQALHCIYRCSSDRLFLHDMMPYLKKYIDWLIRNRDFDGDGLLSIISPFESGIDWKPSFDEVLGQPPGQGSERLFRKVMGVERKNFFHGYNYGRIIRANVFIVKEVLFNTLFVLDLKALASLCDEMNDADAEKYRQHAMKVSKRIMEIMYSKEDAAFFDVYGESNKQLKSLTFTIGVPLLLDEINEQDGRELLRRHYLNTEEFNLAFPIPSVAKNNPAFSPTESKFLWRGPTWIPANWWMQQCFLKYGMIEEAQHLADISVSLIEKSGFREYYNPFTGEGYGAKDFTWGALALDMIRRMDSI
jgi:glycogen debranching enzyme